MKLKPRQLEAQTAIFAALDRGVTRQLINLPTGVGKTVLAAHIATQFDRVLFLAHRQELVEQTARTMLAVDPDRSHGRIEPGIHEIGQFTIAMLPTVYRRLGRMMPDEFDAIIVDECHHAASRTWREVLDHFQPRLRLGLTATPERLDGLALSNLFDEIVYSMNLADAVREQYLAPPSAIQCLTSVNISAVHTRGGDFAEDELANLVDDPARNAFIAEKYLEHCNGRKAIAFCCTIAHAMNLVSACMDVGISAEWISGVDPDRETKLERFAKGEFQVLANCQILTEGFDDRSVDAILLCRPTKSKSLFAQMIGRGLRLNEGKTDCRVLDFVDNAGKHSLVTSWKFFGHTIPPTSEAPLGIADEPKKKESRVAAIDLERQIDLLKPPPVIDEFNYGSRDWHYAPATEKQLLFLQRMGYDTENNDFSKGQASSIIGAQPASWRQLRELADYNYDLSVDWTRGQASKALDESRTVMTTALDKIRSRGFRIAASGGQLKVDPIDQLDLIQRSWIDRNRKPLLSALMAELN
jgi:Type III restriction enzyme, res subunit/Helicase conserved C-terminal domain